MNRGRCEMIFTAWTGKARDKVAVEAIYKLRDVSEAQPSQEISYILQESFLCSWTQPTASLLP